MENWIFEEEAFSSEKFEIVKFLIGLFFWRFFVQVEVANFGELVNILQTREEPEG